MLHPGQSVVDSESVHFFPNYLPRGEGTWGLVRGRSLGPTQVCLLWEAGLGPQGLPPKVRHAKTHCFYWQEIRHYQRQHCSDVPYTLEEAELNDSSWTNLFWPYKRDTVGSTCIDWRMGRLPVRQGCWT